LSKKGITVWLFSSLTFIALIHLIEAISSLIFNNQIRFLQLYPFIGEKLQTITPLTYFIASATATLVLWGITCAAAFTNPVETFLNRILSDAKKQSSVETQMLEEKSEILDVMNETIESSKEVLAQVRDMIYNVRTEVKEIQPLKEGIEKMKSEIGSLRKEVKRLEEKVYFPKVCLNCGKPILPEFKICPYCGENVKFLPENMISVKEYK
jgi:RNA polymerase-binding transcription factor DksA